MEKEYNKKSDQEFMKKQVYENIKKYLLAIEDDIYNINYRDAIGLLSLVTDFKELFDSTKIWENYIYLLLEKVRDGIYCSQYSAFSFFNGLTDIEFELNRLIKYIPTLKRFLYAVEKLQLDYIHDFLHIHKSSSNNFQNNYFELMTGISSPLRYWIDKGSIDVVIELATYLIKNANKKIIIGNQVPGWHYYPLEHEAKYMQTPAQNGCINYGVSHGMAGPLQVLALAYHCGIQINGLLDTIQDLIKEYRTSAYYAENIVYWPGRITVEEYIKPEIISRFPNRMSWCYGSIGILRVLYLASKWISDSENEEFAFNGLLAIAKADNFKYGLTSPILCHGYAGVAAIMNEMYRDTREKKFREKTMNLVEQINKEKDKLEGLFETKRYSYLDGDAGVLQTLYFIVNEKNNESLKRLLII